MLRGIVGLVVLVASLLGACTDDDATTVPASTTSSTQRSASTTTITSNRCVVNEMPDDAEDVRDAVADLDGDGADDEVHSYRVGDDEWHLRVALARGGGADLVVPPFGGSFVSVLGGADVDGDGTDELWARTGQGASATIVSLVRLIGCDLVRVTSIGGDPAELPVGGSVGTASGVECAAREGSDADLTTYTATHRGGDRYDVQATELELDGTALVAGGSYSGEATVGDELFARASSFSCGRLTL